MGRACSTATALALSVVVVGGISGPAPAVTNRVPADYPTIQDALDVSGVGDTVLVAPGTYSDFQVVSLDAVVAILPDGVVLKSEAGAAQTTIDMAPLDGAATWSVGFSCPNHTSGTTVIDGFRITGFPTPSTGVSAGYCAAIDIRNCIFEVEDPPDPSTTRKGVGSLRSEVHVSNCTFIRCSDDFGAGITSTAGLLTVDSCTFIECQNQAIRAAGEGAPGIHTLEVRNCLFQRVSTLSVSGGCIQSASMNHGVLIDGCVFEEPGAEGAVGAAMSISGLGPKVVRNNVVHSMNLGYGASAIVLAFGTATVTGNTFANLHQDVPPPKGTHVALYTSQVSSILFDNNIVAHTSGAPAISGGSAFTSGCNVFWDNVDGIGLTLGSTDRVVDPQFCEPDNQDYTLEGTSPCLPPYSLGCDLIGALGQGCASVSIESTTWGRIKAWHRGTVLPPMR